MAENCLLYYITDRAAFAGSENERRRRLLDKVAEAASAGVDYIQVREKDLTTRELESLAREAVHVIRGLKTSARRKTSLLINSRTDVALASCADGVHLRSDDVTPEDVRTAWRISGTLAHENSHRDPVIGVSCHSPQEVIQAAAGGASFAVFAPVFEKKNSSAAGLEALSQACRAKIPVLALGGVALENAGSCLHAGAAGIAAIRLFQENDISTVVRALRG